MVNIHDLNINNELHIGKSIIFTSNEAAIQFKNNIKIGELNLSEDSNLNLNNGFLKINTNSTGGIILYNDDSPTKLLNIKDNKIEISYSDEKYNEYKTIITDKEISTQQIKGNISTDYFTQGTNNLILDGGNSIN